MSRVIVLFHYHDHNREVNRSFSSQHLISCWKSKLNLSFFVWTVIIMCWLVSDKTKPLSPRALKAEDDERSL